MGQHQPGGRDLRIRGAPPVGRPPLLGESQRMGGGAEHGLCGRQRRAGPDLSTLADRPHVETLRPRSAASCGRPAEKDRTLCTACTLAVCGATDSVASSSAAIAS